MWQWEAYLKRRVKPIHTITLCNNNCTYCIRKAAVVSAKKKKKIAGENQTSFNNTPTSLSLFISNFFFVSNNKNIAPLFKYFVLIAYIKRNSILLKIKIEMMKIFEQKKIFFWKKYMHKMFFNMKSENFGILREENRKTERQKNEEKRK